MDRQQNKVNFKRNNLNKQTIDCRRSMEKRLVICFLYCFLVMIAPIGHSLYTIVVQNVTYFISFPQFYFVRAYLSNGPAISKTAIHGMMIALTYTFQVELTYLYGLTVFGYFGDAAESFLENHSDVLCVLASPGPISLALSLYLMYLAILRLFMAVDVAKYMELDHEAIVKWVNIGSLGVLTVHTILEVLVRGTNCNSFVAMKIINIRLNINATLENLPLNKTMPSPLDSIAAVVAAVCYILSLIIMAIKEFGKEDPVSEEVVARAQQARNQQLVPASGDKQKKLTIRGPPKAVRPLGIISPIISEGNCPPLREIKGNILKVKKENREIRRPSSLPSNLANALVNERETTMATPYPLLISVRPKKLAIQNQSAESPDSQKAEMGNASGAQEVRRKPQNELNPQSVRSESRIKTNRGATSLQISPGEEGQSRRRNLTTPTGTSERKKERKKLLQKLFFAAMFVIYIIIHYTTTPSSKNIKSLLLSKGFKVVFECLPMYWVLMLDDCFVVARRRTITFMANTFHIYLED